jgi:hypothetical protein
MLVTNSRPFPRLTSFTLHPHPLSASRREYMTKRRPLETVFPLYVRIGVLFCGYGIGGFSGKVVVCFLARWLEWKGGGHSFSETWYRDGLQDGPCWMGCSTVLRARVYAEQIVLRPLGMDRLVVED